MDERARELFDRLANEQMVMHELIARLRELVDEAATSDAGACAGPHRAVVDVPLIEVHCLGTFELRIDGQVIDNWRPTKALALFQYLVAHRGGPTPRETLIDALWPDPDALAAGSSLKVAVHSLRQNLAGLGERGARFSIQAHPAGYQLSAPELWVDAEEFERYCSEGRLLEVQGRLEESTRQYGRAADLYRGDFLKASLADWAVLRRESLKDQYLFLLGRLAEAAFADRDHHACILRCQQLLEHDACREDAYRLLMAAHGRLGQRARVQSWYDLCARSLWSKLDSLPEPLTDHVYRQALRGGRETTKPPKTERSARTSV